MTSNGRRSTPTDRANARRLVEEDEMSLPQAAAALGWSDGTLRRWATEGKWALPSTDRNRRAAAAANAATRRRWAEIRESLVDDTAQIADLARQRMLEALEANDPFSFNTYATGWARVMTKLEGFAAASESATKFPHEASAEEVGEHVAALVAEIFAE